MSDVHEVIAYHEAYNATLAGRLEQSETVARQLGPAALASHDQLRAHVDHQVTRSLHGHH